MYNREIVRAIRSSNFLFLSKGHVFSIEFYILYKCHSNMYITWISLFFYVCIVFFFFSFFNTWQSHVGINDYERNTRFVECLQIKNETGNGRLVRGKGTSGESSRHSRYAVSGLLCPNFCAHLSAHPFANPGIPRPGRPTLLLASLVTGFHFWSRQASDEPFSIFSLFISSTLCLTFSFCRSLCFRLSYLCSRSLFCSETPLFLLTAS